MRAPFAAFSAALLALVILPGCNSPESVAKFCSSAVFTLTTGEPLFDDIQASCVREAQTRETFGTFALTDPNPPVCENLHKQADGLKAASRILTAYFSALHDLAAYGTSKTGDSAKDLFTTASKQGKLGEAQQKALGSIVSLLVRAAVSGYQAKHLSTDIVSVREDIQVALDGLGEAIGTVYLHQLEDEEKKTATRYREFLLEHQNSGDLAVALDSRWNNDRAMFVARKRAAANYKAALETIAKGHADLAAHAREWKAKDLPGILSPYTSQLEGLAPAIQKAFF